MSGRTYVMQFVLIFLGMCPFIAWGLILMYLEERDRKHKQSQEKPS